MVIFNNMSKRRGVFRTRHKIGKTAVYAKRDKKGRFVDIQSVKLAAQRDLRKRAKAKVKPGYGFKGDLRRKKR